MRISVVTVVFNDLIGLQRTADSIFLQNNNDYEWVVCDGGSKSELQDYLNSLPRSVRWVSESDKGIYDAMNKGVRLTQGDYVVFLNAGDVFPDSNTLDQVVNKLKPVNHRVIDVLFGGANFELPSGNFLYRGTRLIEDYIWHGLPANHQATYYRREILLKDNYDLKYKICGDYYLAACLFKLGITADYLEVPLVNFQLGGASYMNRQLLFSEPYIIQRDVLGLSFLLRIKSIIKRLISTIVMMVVTQRWFPSFLFRIS